MNPKVPKFRKAKNYRIDEAKYREFVYPFDGYLRGQISRKAVCWKVGITDVEFGNMADFYVSRMKNAVPYQEKIINGKKCMVFQSSINF